MKPIKLTEEHKSKLLEMCKVLFPEPKYRFSWEYDMFGRGLKQAFNDVLCVTHKYKNPIIEVYNGREFKTFDNSFNIHWFEFCMTHLFNKLLSKNYINAPAFYTSILGAIHPVDYLYEQFKKLNINNDEVFCKLKEIIQNILCVEKVEKDYSFKDDLNADSLDITEICLSCENKFNIKIDDEDLFRMVKVEELYNYIKEKIE